MASVFYYLTQTYGRVTTIRFFRAVVDLQGEREDLDWSHVRAQFEALAASDEIKVGEGKLMSFDALIGGTSEVFEGKISNARAYAHRLDTFTALSRNGHSLVFRARGRAFSCYFVQRAPTHRESRISWPRCKPVSDKLFSTSKRRSSFSSCADLHAVVLTFFFWLGLQGCNYG
ncbi:hypothetical protein EI94DRAFT_1342955 [Lactarius quietus]|nr:hypothetical protein EI94DRAFT_1342955 [Lactarius quietus]